MTVDVQTLEQETEEAPVEERQERPRLWRRIAIGVVAFLMAPYVLILIYRLDFIHPVSTLMLADLATFQGYDRRWVGFEDISPNVVRAVMMSEDGQFCSHDGVDWGQLKGVVDDALAGEATRGASTIPMQTAKNLFLWNSRSFIRKGLELPLALVADAVWPKERTMEIYLNIAEWGPQGEFGVAAGSERAFGREPQNLDWRTASLLAVTLPNPIVRNPARPNAGLLRVAGIVEERARTYGERAACVGKNGRLDL